MRFDPNNPSYGGKPGAEKGILQATYKNAASLSKEIEEMGFRGLQTLTIDGIGAYPDRRKFEIEGNGFIVAPPFMHHVAALKGYNLDLHFGISINGEGTDDGDDWVDFDTEFLGTPAIAPPWFTTIRNVLFHRIWVRNNVEDAVPDNESIRLYIIQDVSFIEQVNKLLRNITA